jgi:hypothetical protein
MCWTSGVRPRVYVLSAVGRVGLDENDWVQKCFLREIDTECRGGKRESASHCLFAVGENLDLLLRYGPYRMNSNGIGTMIRAINPRRVEAHRGFNF